MYFKVIKDNKVIDVLNNPKYVKYQKKHDQMLLCEECEAQGVVSSDEKYIWHVDVLPSIPKNEIETVSLVEIDQYEYDKLKIFNCKTVSQIIDEYTYSLLEGGIL